MDEYIKDYMEEYEFKLIINNAVCGNFTKEGKTISEAFDKAWNEICDIMNQLPATVHVEYSIGMV